MSDFYIKNKKGEFLPINLSTYINKDLEGKLVIVRVGTDIHPVSVETLDETEESFSRADVLSDLEDVSVIITPYQIDVGLANKEDVEDKALYVQITSGDDISSLTEIMKRMAKNLRKKFNLAVLPAPLKLKEFRQVRDILKRCEIRRQRRGRVRG